MAASVVTFPRVTRDSVTDIGLDEELEGVLPSEIDCHGRPLPTMAMALRRVLVVETLKTLVVVLRRVSF